MKIKFENVSFIYAHKTPFAKIALEQLSWQVIENKVTTLIGSTGSGKSTAARHINALLLPTGGKVFTGEFLMEKKKIKIWKNGKYKRTRRVKTLRKKIGYVTQLPEYQLFEDTIYKDLIFGPKNFKTKTKNLRQDAIQTLNSVGLDESYLERNPLDLSGGQKRRVALAGILIMSPDVLILDEPTAGLDPEGNTSIKKIIKNLSKDNSKTIILISHDMNLAMELSDHIIWMEEGRILKEGKPSEVFSGEFDPELHILEPDVIRFQKQLFGNISDEVQSIEDLAERIKRECND